MGHPRRRVTHGAAGVALVAGVLAGCSPDEVPGEQQTPTPRSVALRVESVSGADHLDEEDRTALETEIGDVLSHYVVRGFLGDFPRREFVASFESFTSGAARHAARDIEQLTAARVQDATAVRATRLDADLSFLVDGQDVIGATAAVRFAFEATMEDGKPRPLSLRGRFLLEEGAGEWSIFGYDVALDDGATLETGVAP
ncbi:hypothetical protein [Nocardioides gansuensis]|uniref:hypothetical protein n=1 Tax=Nocardioides gansuensis TaxID=2138300 RepID=UPI0010579BDF|nr:hypothetical protein [Nocardioides gansuensis]